MLKKRPWVGANDAVGGVRHGHEADRRTLSTVVCSRRLAIDGLVAQENRAPRPQLVPATGGAATGTAAVVDRVRYATVRTRCVTLSRRSSIESRTDSMASTICRV